MSRPLKEIPEVLLDRGGKGGLGKRAEELLQRGQLAARCSIHEREQVVCQLRGHILPIGGDEVNTAVSVDQGISYLLLARPDQPQGMP